MRALTGLDLKMRSGMHLPILFTATVVLRKIQVFKWKKILEKYQKFFFFKIPPWRVTHKSRVAVSEKRKIKYSNLCEIKKSSKKFLYAYPIELDKALILYYNQVQKLLGQPYK